MQKEWKQQDRYYQTNGLYTVAANSIGRDEDNKRIFKFSAHKENKLLGFRDTAAQARELCEKDHLKQKQ